MKILYHLDNANQASKQLYLKLSDLVDPQEILLTSTRNSLAYALAIHRDQNLVVLLQLDERQADCNLGSLRQLLDGYFLIVVGNSELRMKAQRYWQLYPRLQASLEKDLDLIVTVVAKRLLAFGRLAANDSIGI